MRIKTSFIIVFIMAAGAVFAESLHEQLKQMVAQLQKSPNDNALRVKIIKSAQELKPAPAVPEEAERFEGRAQFAFKNAKSPVDYLYAAKEYEKAIAAAPWVPGYYYDLCTIYEKAEKYAEAKKNCEFFLASSPSEQDASDARKRIAGLEFAMEKANSPEARAMKQKTDGESALRSIDGERFRMVTDLGTSAVEIIFEVHGKTMVETHRLLSIDHRKFTTLDEMSTPGQTREADLLTWRNGAFVYSDSSGGLVISQDGGKLTRFYYKHGAVVMLEEDYAVRQ